MSKSKRSFDRWVAHDKTTWPFQIFQKYNDELHRILNTHLVSTAYLYRNLKSAGAQWDDHPSQFFDPKGRDFELYGNLREWSDWYNLFDNWVTLSRILTICSTIETYLASVIALALESDPGLAVGVSRAIDGAAVLKRQTRKGFDMSSQIEACVKGDWSSRLDAFGKLFGACPDEFRATHSCLEELRNIRNRFGHAFGRDIDEARNHGVLRLLPMERVMRERANKLWKEAFNALRAVDRFLLDTHIGDFEVVRLFHVSYATFQSDKTVVQKAFRLKKMIGRLGANARGKKYCAELIQYWEAL
jgi:hypothetical protein